MGAPGTIVEGAEKPVMRAVVVEVRREVKEKRRVRGRILVCLVGFAGGFLDVYGVEVGFGLWLFESTWYGKINGKIVIKRKQSRHREQLELV
jgi:hypothetical protein